MLRSERVRRVRQIPRGRASGIERIVNVRALLEHLLQYLLDGRGAADPIVVLVDGKYREIESIEIRPVPDGHPRPIPTFVLLIADGPPEFGSAIRPPNSRA